MSYLGTYQYEDKVHWLGCVKQNNKSLNHRHTKNIVPREAYDIININNKE